MSDRPVTPCPPSLEERVARLLFHAEYGEQHDWDEIGTDDFKRAFGKRAVTVLAALTTEDLLALLQSQSDEVVVSFNEGEVKALALLAQVAVKQESESPVPLVRQQAALIESARSKLSAAAERMEVSAP